MKIHKFLFLAICMVPIYGCGVRFSDEAINRALPTDYTNRNIYPESDIFKYELDALVGRIMVCEPDEITERVYDCDLTLQRIIKNGTTPQTISPEKIIYSSKIDQGAATQGSYLGFAANFKADQAAEVLISDAAYVFVKSDDVPEAELKEYVRLNPRVGDEKRFWIRAALLATIIQRDLVEIEANADGVVGNTSGLKGGVYNRQGQESTDFRISLRLPDIDRELGKPIDEFTSSDAENHGILIRSIEGIESLPLAIGD